MPIRMTSDQLTLMCLVQGARNVPNSRWTDWEILRRLQPPRLSSVRFGGNGVPDLAADPQSQRGFGAAWNVLEGYVCHSYLARRRSRPHGHVRYEAGSS